MGTERRGAGPLASGRLGHQKQSSAVSMGFARIPGLSDRKIQRSPLVLDDKARHILAGIAARTTAQCAIHPVDTIKTRLQVSKPNCARLVRWKSEALVRKTWLQLGSAPLLRTRNYVPFGAWDLYRGVWGAFLGTIPVALLYFATYTHVKEHAHVASHGDRVAHVVAAGAGAIASTVVRVPTDTLRHRVQAYLHPNVFAAVPQLALAKGPRGFFAGFVPTLLRDVPEIAIQFALYESLRSTIQRRADEKLATWQHLVLGGAAGAAAAVMTMPLDVAKTHMQCGGSKVRAMGLPMVMRNLCAEHGAQALFAGMGPRVVQVAAMSALFFSLFEFWKAQLKPAALREGNDRLLGRKLYEKRRAHIWKRQFAFR